MAFEAVEQCGPSAAEDGNGTWWPIRVSAANPPEINGHNGLMKEKPPALWGRYAHDRSPCAIAYVEYTDSTASNWEGPPSNLTKPIKIAVAANQLSAHHAPESGRSNQAMRALGRWSSVPTSSCVLPTVASVPRSIAAFGLLTGCTPCSLG